MILWLVGGLDPTGGAGILRDAWVARARAPAASVSCAVTAFTWQGHGKIARARPVDAAGLGSRLARFAPPASIKLGLVPDACAETIGDTLAAVAGPIVFDPVLRASDGGALEATAQGVSALVDLAALVTPNTDEAAALTGARRPGSELLEALVEKFPHTSFLLKGGHEDDGDSVADLLFHEGRAHRFARPRQPGPDIRGTGCALATAIACALAGGASMVDAVGGCIAWLDETRPLARSGPDGRLHLPV